MLVQSRAAPVEATTQDLLEETSAQGMEEDVLRLLPPAWSLCPRHLSLSLQPVTTVTGMGAATGLVLPARSAEAMKVEEEATGAIRTIGGALIVPVDIAAAVTAPPDPIGWGQIGMARTDRVRTASAQTAAGLSVIPSAQGQIDTWIGLGILGRPKRALVAMYGMGPVDTSGRAPIVLPIVPLRLSRPPVLPLLPWMMCSSRSLVTSR